VSPTVHGPGGRAALLLLAPVLALTAACTSTTHAGGSNDVNLTIEGKQVIDPAGLESAGERELAYTLGFGYVSSSSTGPARCWFANTGSSGEVDERLWCGPVQVPGSPPTNGWVPIPMKKTAENAGQIQLQVQPPEVPLAGNRSTPVGNALVRSDGSTVNPTVVVDRTAGANFVAVLSDTDHRSNASLGLSDAPAVRMHDDLLSVTATGWGHPGSFPLPDAVTLRPDAGQQLRVLRLHVEKPIKTDPAFSSQQWEGYAPQHSTLSLEVNGRGTMLPDERLPDTGDVFVLYTAPASATADNLVLGTVGSNSLAQRMAVPSGKRADIPPAALARTTGVGKVPANATQTITVGTGRSYGDSPAGTHQGSLKVTGVRLGWQRPVKLDDGDYQLITELPPGKALLEVDVKATGDRLPAIMAGPVTKVSFQVTLPDGSRAPLVGVRSDGDLFPVALIAEVPADVTSVKIGLRSGPVRLSALGKVDLTATGAPIDLPLDLQMNHEELAAELFRTFVAGLS
jgi:hypothetical protein